MPSAAGHLGSPLTWAASSFMSPPDAHRSPGTVGIARDEGALAALPAKAPLGSQPVEPHRMRIAPSRRSGAVAIDGLRRVDGRVARTAHT
jgi:hypothetical protein